MHFAYSVILWALPAVAAPVVIHLILRARTRVVALPTLRFVRQTHLRGLSRHRLRRLILLLLRMAAVALVVLIVARAFWFRETAGPTPAPTALAVVMDTSASMACRHGESSALENARQAVARIVGHLPDGSRVVVLTAEASASDPVFLDDLKLAAQHVRDAPQSEGGQPLSSAIRRALDMLATTDLPNREVIIATDLTPAAWRQMIPISKAAAPGVRFTVIDAGRIRPVNACVESVRLDPSSLPAGEECRLLAVLTGEGLSGEMSLQVDLDGRAVERRSVDLPPGGAVTAEFLLRPDTDGVQVGRVVLRRDDDLPLDNERYVCLDVRPPAEVLIVSTPAPDDPTAFLMANAVAPPLASGGLKRRTISPEQLDERALRDASLVLLAGPAGLADAQWKRLESFVQRGGAVWIVVGSMVSPEGYNTPAAQRVLPVRLGRVQELRPPMSFRTVGAAQAILQPFADPGNPPLSEVHCRRRFALESVASDADVALAYDDGAPAILTRGKVWLWNVSPAPEWSNLGRLGGQLVVLAQRTAELLLGDTAPVQAEVGRTVEMSLPSSMARPTITVLRAGEAAPRPVEAAPMQRGRRIVRLPSDRAGGYIVTFSENQSFLRRGYSVNVPLAESDLARLTQEEIRNLFPPGGLEILSSEAGRIAWNVRGRRSTDSLPALFLLLLTVLVGESYFANRFYPQAGDEDGKNPPSGISD